MQMLLRLLITALLLVGIIQPPVTYAARKDATIYERLQWPFYDLGSDADATGECNPSLSGSENAKRIFNFFREKGLEPWQAAGIIGNMKHESGLEPQRMQGVHDRKVPAEEWQDINGGGWGIVQWTKGTKFINPTKDAGKDPNELVIQLEFLWDQLEGRGPIPEKQVGDDIKQTKDVENATVAFQGTMNDNTPGKVVTYKGKTYGPYLGFERPDDQQASIASRIDFSKSILLEYRSSTGGSGGCNDDGSIGTSPDGFVFPLKTTKAKVKEGVDGAVWCHGSSGNCHHDYKAADIHVETGTPVLAVRGGTIKNIRSQPARLVLLADNGRTYYFTHLQAGSITVKEGQSVRAGDIIGRIGTNADAEGSVRHLHIDELPTTQFDFRPSCENAACQAFPFIDIQPELLASFNTLP